MLNEITLTVIVIRRQLEAELNLLEEETTRRLEESIRKNVEEKLNSEEVQSEIERRIEEGQKKLFDDVVAQLLKEKEAALVEERRKEVRILNSHSLLVSYCGGLEYKKFICNKVLVTSFHLPPVFWVLHS